VLLEKSTNTSRNGILPLLLNSWLKVRTDSFWNMSFSLWTSSVFSVNMRMSSTYQTYILGAGTFLKISFSMCAK